MTRLIAKHTGQPVARVERDSLRDRWFSAEEARGYGMIDQLWSRSMTSARGREPDGEGLK